MSEEKLSNDLLKAEDQMTFELQGPGLAGLKVTLDQLEELAFTTSRVTKIVVGADRNLNKGNYENERYEQSTEVDFSWFWSMVNPADLVDPARAVRVQRAFANGAMRSIGVAYRDIYVNHLYSVASRSRQLALPQQKPILVELNSLRSPVTYDPFNVVEKEAK